MLTTDDEIIKLDIKISLGLSSFWWKAPTSAATDRNNEFAITLLQQEPNQLLWQSLYVADTMTLFSC